MRDGFDADSQAILDLSAAYADVAAQLKGLDVATSLSATSDSLPGSRTAVAVAGLGVTLGAAVIVVGERAEQMSSCADATSRTYTAADEFAGQLFVTLGAPR